MGRCEVRCCNCHRRLTAKRRRRRAQPAMDVEAAARGLESTAPP
jgi:hypothetical protein